jgi:hypothetical protein
MTEEQRAAERAQKRLFYQRNKDTIREKARAYYQRTLETRRAERRKTHWKVRGVDAATVPAVRGSVCEICGREDRIHLDHNHVTGAFRGWLCLNCNRALGLVRDNPVILRALAAYLEREK